jgi:phosphatidylglycerophosphate synthase
VSRALKRPRRGWGRRSLFDRFLDSLADGLLWCILICFLAAVAISMAASTIKVIEDVIYYYENLETVEDTN